MSSLEDPRVLFAAERTLMAWNRTSISLMVFGFVIERFGLFLEVMRREQIEIMDRFSSFILGEAFVLLGAYISLYSIWQYRRVLHSLNPAEVPEGYGLYVGVLVNGIVGALGLTLSLYLIHGVFSH